MQNTLLLFLRQTRELNHRSIATHLGISITEYREIENGGAMLTYKQAHQLGGLMNINSRYIYDAACQLDMLLAKTELIRLQKDRISRLKQRLQELQGNEAN